MVQFDVGHVFQVFGGPRGLLTILDRHLPRHGLPYNTVQMWSHRAAIPAKWWAAVLYAAEREGHDCREFMTDNDEFVVRSEDTRHACSRR